VLYSADYFASQTWSSFICVSYLPLE